MKSLKVMGIIGIVLAVLALYCLMVFCNEIDYEAAIGWGVYATLYLLAFSIVVLVNNKKEKK